MYFHKFSIEDYNFDIETIFLSCTRTSVLTLSNYIKKHVLRLTT